MLCPFNRDVDEPPSIFNCPHEMGVCPCSHHMGRYAFGLPNDKSMEVIAFWQQHPNRATPPDGVDRSLRVQRYEEHVAYVVGVARKVATEYSARQRPGTRTRITVLELTLEELVHAIGVLDLDGVEPDHDGDTPQR